MEPGEGDRQMKSLVLRAPEFGFMVGTRAALAAGIGLLLASRWSTDQRRLIGATLVAIGAMTTIPAAMMAVRGVRRARRQELPPGIQVDERLIGATRFPRKGDDEGF
jgi:hypothetical protein